MMRRGSTGCWRASSRGTCGRDGAHRSGAAVPRVAGRGRIRDRADPLLRRREVVGIRLLGDLHRDGGLRAQRRGPGAVPRRFRAPWRDAAGGAAGAAGRHRGDRLPLHHDQPVQSAAIAESGDLGAAALEHRRLLRVPAAVLLSRRRIRQPELRAERGPHRPGLRLRPDRRGRRRGAGAGCDVRGARVLPGAAAARASGGQCLLRRGTLALGGRRGGRCRAARRRGAAAARQPGGVQRLQGDLCAAAHARRARGRHRAVATRRLRAAGRFHRARRHRHLEQCRHARRTRSAADLRAVSRRQSHCRPAQDRCARCRIMPPHRSTPCHIG